MTAIYIHIPYCRSKCPYCDFASVPVDESVDAYLRALAREVACVSEAIPPAETVYIGGGTPTVLTPKQICRLFEGLRERLEISPLAEITIEANPCSLSATKARLLASNGVNRVSLGAQSFVDSELSFLGRSHGVEDILHSFRWLREAGMDNVNLDLIYAIPIQYAENWRYSLAQAIDLKPEHISTYCLTFEPPTPLWQLSQGGKIKRKTDEEEVEFS
ncbi:MAG: coproporphyrinogen III oxidase family protein, partial [Candidatus Hydrogenedentota bacterium]